MPNMKRVHLLASTPSGFYDIERKWTGESQPDTWTFCHVEYDGPEDGRCGTGRTIDEVLDQIEDLEIESE